MFGCGDHFISSFYLHANRFHSPRRHAKSHSFVSVGLAPRHRRPAAWRRQERFLNTELNAIFSQKRGKFLLLNRGSAMTNPRRIMMGKIPTNVRYCSGQKRRLRPKQILNLLNATCILFYDIKCFKISDLQHNSSPTWFPKSSVSSLIIHKVWVSVAQSRPDSAQLSIVPGPFISSCIVQGQRFQNKVMKPYSSTRLRKAPPI